MPIDVQEIVKDFCADPCDDEPVVVYIEALEDRIEKLEDTVHRRNLLLKDVRKENLQLRDMLNRHVMIRGYEL